MRSLYLSTLVWEPHLGALQWPINDPTHWAHAVVACAIAKIGMIPATVCLIVTSVTAVVLRRYVKHDARLSVLISDDARRDDCCCRCAVHNCSVGREYPPRSSSSNICSFYFLSVLRGRHCVARAGGRSEGAESVNVPGDSKRVQPITTSCIHLCIAMNLSIR